MGLSRERASVGSVVLRNLVGGGFGGVVYPVDGEREAVEGVAAYRSFAELPAPPDVVLVCAAPASVSGLVAACVELGVAGLVVLSGGPGTAGSGSAALGRMVSEEAARVGGLRVLGASVGFMVPRLGLNASLAGPLPAAGSVALVSQTGALNASLVDWAGEQGVGFSYVVALGDMLDVDLGDMVDFLADDAGTGAIVLQLESITNVRRFMSAARAFARRKPIVAYKSRWAAPPRDPVSHAGVLADEEAVYDAALERAGIVRVQRIDEVFGTAELLARERLPRGARLAVVTNAGEPVARAAHALLAGGPLEASERIEARQDGGPAAPARRGRTIVVPGDAPADGYAAAVAAALADDGVDAVLVILTQRISDPAATAEAIAAARGSSRKPLLAVWMGGRGARAGRARLAAAGVVARSFPEPAIGELAHLVRYSRLRALLHETPRAIPYALALDRPRVAELLVRAHASEGPLLSESASKALLDAYEIPVTTPVPAASAAETVAVAERLGYPVVLKVDAPEVIHKTDVGGVQTGLANAAEVVTAYRRIATELRASAPQARLRGVTVQPMVNRRGYELVVGARKHPDLGAVIMVGAGGLATELLADRALELPPLNERLARRLLESLRIWPLLRGYRRRPPVDLDRLLELLLRFSYLVADHPEIAELDVNPLLAAEHGAVALDARVVLDPELLRAPPPRFSHLAIRPYPEEYTTAAQLPDGRTVTLRPIKPEDEPLWNEMIAACSEDTVRRRFRSLFKPSRELATRFCFIDYDRELAIVAELEEHGSPRLIGVAGLAADPDRRRAEYAILIADRWQQLGLSTPLTDYCLSIARAWGVDQLFAETTPDNAPMIAVMQRHGFEISHHETDGIVVGERPLRAAGAAPR